MITAEQRAQAINTRFDLRYTHELHGWLPPGFTEEGWNKKVPPRFRDARFDGSHPLEVMAWADRLVTEMRKNGYLSESLYLYGETGSGKTHLAWAVLRRCWEEQLQFAHVNLFRLAELLRHDCPENLLGEADRLYGCDVLLIDDLGSTQVSDWALGALYELVNDRHSSVVPIITTSNLTPEELAQSFDDRIARRLLDGVGVLVPPRNGVS
mgnify:FL=1